MESLENNKSQFPSFILNLIEKVGSVSDDQIADLEKKLHPEVIPAFRKKSQEQKMVIVTIHNLSEAEIRKLYEIASDEQNAMKYLVGFHDVKSALNLLLNYTDDIKYDFLRNPDK